MLPSSEAGLALSRQPNVTAAAAGPQTQLGATPSGADLVSTTRYNLAGQPIESRLPAGGDAHSTVTSYRERFAIDARSGFDATPVPGKAYRCTQILTTDIVEKRYNLSSLTRCA